MRVARIETPVWLLALAVAVWLIALGVAVWLLVRTPDPTPGLLGPGWQQVTRTVDGLPTVVQPEDLDRP